MFFNEYLYGFLSRHPVGITIASFLTSLLGWVESIATHIKLASVYLSFFVLLLTAIVKAIDTYDKIRLRLNPEDAVIEVETDKE